MKNVSKPFSTDSLIEINRLELALDAACVGTWELDITDNRFRVCERFKSILGHPFDDITDLHVILEQIHSEDREKAMNDVRNTLSENSNGKFTTEFRTIRSNEEKPHWINCKGQTHFNSEGRPYKLSGIALDVSDSVISRKLLEQTTSNLRKREAEMRMLIENTPDAITRWNKNLKLIFGNPAFERKIGRELDILLNKDSVEMDQPREIAIPYMECIKKTFETGDPQEHYNNLMTPQGEVSFFSRLVPEFSADGTIESVLSIARDITEIKASENRFRTLIQEAPVATSLFTGKNLKIELANETMINYWGKDNSVIGKPLSEALPELEGQPFLQILDEVFRTGETYESRHAPVNLEVNGKLSTFYFDFTYKALRDAENKIYGIMNMAVDVTPQVLALTALKESEARLRSVIQASPAAIGLFVGRDLVVEMPNQAFINIVGKGPDVVGKPLREVMPELESQEYLQILDDVFTSGKMYQSFGTQVNIVQHGVMTNNFYNISYTPLFDSEGKVYAILDIAIDVTESLLARQKIEESQLELLALFEQSPVAIAIIRREDLIFTMVNPFYAELVGRKPDDLIGKSLLEALPELDGQGFDTLIQEVMSTGISFNSKEKSVDIIRNNKLETIYVDLTYQPQRAKDGDVPGVLVVATDVTQQVLSRQAIQEAEATLRGAVELADLGTWQIDMRTGGLEYSQRLRAWFGYGQDELITIEKAYAPIREADRILVQTGIINAIMPGTDGIFDVEYTVEASVGRKERILHALGKAFVNEKGEKFKIIGTVHDVTEQRKTTLALEQQVQERTEELEATNEELAAINEEYMATNEELTQSNDLLTRSNDNLQRFAYVASHDLQEPLRKIQSFGDLLTRRFAGDLGEGAEYLQRMQSAAKRMSVLIDDLLSFSRVSSSKDDTVPVSLNSVVKAVLTDLELTIQETNAVVRVDRLPTVLGDPLQLGQLFQNLLSNALKFRRPGISPVINIRSEAMDSIDLPFSVKPTKASQVYYRIDVQDNGIGFDDKYTDRIFQIFQRLHGKNEFAGTGIGLAICEKVAANHGGAISATSEQGTGSTFSLYLPF